MWKVFTSNADVQYDGPITSGKKVITNIKVFQKQVKLWGQGHKVKKYGTMWTVLSQAIHMCNMQALSLLARKLWPRFFQKYVKLKCQGHEIKTNGTM